MVKQGDVTGHEHPRERLRIEKTFGPYFLVVFCKPTAHGLFMCSEGKVGEGEGLRDQGLRPCVSFR